MKKLEKAEESEETDEDVDPPDIDTPPPPTSIPRIDPDEVGRAEELSSGDVGLIGPRGLDPTDGAGETAGGADPVTPVSNPCMIAMDLSRLTPLEIRSYPTSQFSSSDLESIFECLGSVNLAKILVNIPLGDLRVIQTALTPLTFEQILDRLYETDKTEVQNKLSSSTP